MVIELILIFSFVTFIAARFIGMLYSVSKTRELILVDKILIVSISAIYIVVMVLFIISIKRL